MRGLSNAIKHEGWNGAVDAPNVYRVEASGIRWSTVRVKSGDTEVQRTPQMREVPMHFQRLYAGNDDFRDAFYAMHDAVEALPGELIAEGVSCLIRSSTMLACQAISP